MSVTTVALGEVATLQAGIGFPPALQGRSDGDFPFAKVGDISRCGRSEFSVLSTADHYIDESDVAQLRAKPIPVGSVLFAKIGEAIRQNHRVIAGRPLLIDNNAMAAIPSERIDSRFLYHYLKTVDFYALAPATTVPALRKSELDGIRVPFFPLEEQRRIAAILDQAETLRTQRRTALALQGSLTQSLFLDMFGDPVANPKGWQARELQDVVKQDTIVTYGIVQAGEEFPGGIPYIRTGDIVDGSIRLSGLRHTDPEIAAKFARSRVEENEIVMSIRATVGTTALVPVELSGANLTQGTARIAPGADVHFQYLLYFLRSDATQQWIERQVKGATFREITLGRLRELPVLVPPLLLQQTFATRIASIEALKTTHRRALAALDALFASLQQRAFAGAL